MVFLKPKLKRPKKNSDALPRIAKPELRLAYCHLMLDLDALFTRVYASVGVTAYESWGVRPIYQEVLCNHCLGERSTAHHISQALHIPRTTVQRGLDTLVSIGWVSHKDSHYWVSEEAAKLPLRPRAAYHEAAEIVAKAHKVLRKFRKNNLGQYPCRKPDLSIGANSSQGRSRSCGNANSGAFSRSKNNGSAQARATAAHRQE